MKFRTEIPIPQFPFQIGYDDQIMLLGSCFSNHIGNLLITNRFSVCSNPFGTLFNPISIANNIGFSISPETFSEEYLYLHDGRWISFAHQTKNIETDKKQFINNIKKQLSETYSSLKKTTVLFLTFGTAYYYKFIERNIIVANCHKIPNPKFEKLRLSIYEIVSCYDSILNEIYKINPKIKIVFTVSPVRHLSDGFNENQISKSILHLAIEQLVNNESRFYFPAYEIFIDDLRDYRFYCNDLCHPAENGIQYIEEFFSKSFFTPETEQKRKEFIKQNLLENHRPLK